MKIKSSNKAQSSSSPPENATNPAPCRASLGALVVNADHARPACCKRPSCVPVCVVCVASLIGPNWIFSSWGRDAGITRPQIERCWCCCCGAGGETRRETARRVWCCVRTPRADSGARGCIMLQDRCEFGILVRGLILSRVYVRLASGFLCNSRGGWCLIGRNYFASK